MRAVILGLAGLIVAGDAMAADYLRGSTYEGPPSTGYSWAGVYVGGQMGYANETLDLTGAPSRQVASLAAHSFLEETGTTGTERRVSEWLSLPLQGASQLAYGGFIGWNSQWGD